jgi:hypothetical protein
MAYYTQIAWCVNLHDRGHSALEPGNADSDFPTLFC